MPQDYFTYHFSEALPNYIKTRPDHLSSIIQFFNIENLAKNLFSPYRRIIATEKTTLLDKISFDAISITIGAIVRAILISFGIITLALFAIYDLLTIPFYAIPIFSLPGYLAKKQKTFFEQDLENPKTYVNKILSSQYFQTLSLFFDNGFGEPFKNMPSPKSLQVSTKQTLPQVIESFAVTLPPLKNYLEKQNIDAKSFSTLARYIQNYLENPPKAKITPIGQMLSFGYTKTLDMYGEELTIKALPHYVINPKILEKIEEVLTRPQSNNALLVGEAGVGRHSTLMALANAISKYELPKLRDKRLILLDTIALLGASSNLIEIKADFERLLQEAKHAGNIILAIDQIDKICSSLDNRIDLSEAITSALDNNSTPIIGITTTDDYNKYIRPNSQMVSLFEKLNIEEPNTEENLTILIGKALEIYKKEKVTTTLQALLEIANKSVQIPDDRHQPEKAIVVLEDAVANAHKSKKTAVDIDIVDNTLAEISKIPIGKIREGEKEKLRDLESFLHEKIVGQNEAIVEISKAMRRSRSGIEKTQKTMGAFLFLGPTGVGKTETAKALLSAYFGKDSKMIRLDMTEFQGQDALGRLIGNPQTQSPGQLANLVRQNPYGVLLLDEFEKASRDVQNLFLQVIDEGNLTDAFGKKVNFNNIIIIATSNAGAEYIREQVEKGEKELSQTLIEHILSQNLFSPELINRFDAVVVYHPLLPQEVSLIAKMMLAKLAEDVKETKNITLEITNSLAETVAQKGYNPAFGARPIKRLIADKIEDGIAKMVISEEVKNGSTISAETLLKFVA